MIVKYIYTNVVFVIGECMTSMHNIVCVFPSNLLKTSIKQHIKLCNQRITYFIGDKFFVT